MSNYSDKLKDSRWQRRRAEISLRDGYICQGCHADDHRPVQVHHKYYRWGADPWDYPDDALVTLCDDCHAEEHDLEPEQKEIVADIVYKELDVTAFLLARAKAMGHWDLVPKWERVIELRPLIINGCDECTMREFTALMQELKGGNAVRSVYDNE